MFISQATYRLVQGFLTVRTWGPRVEGRLGSYAGVSRAWREGEAHSRFEVSVKKGLTPLVGREEELGLLRRRWEQAKAGAGQVVLLSGEPGIGKSRLVQALKERLRGEGAARVECRCSPFHQNSALYPVIEHLQRLLEWSERRSPKTSSQTRADHSGSIASPRQTRCLCLPPFSRPSSCRLPAP